MREFIKCDISRHLRQIAFLKRTLARPFSHFLTGDSFRFDLSPPVTVGIPISEDPPRRSRKLKKMVTLRFAETILHTKIEPTLWSIHHLLKKRVQSNGYILLYTLIVTSRLRWTTLFSQTSELRTGGILSSYHLWSLMSLWIEKVAEYKED